MLALLSLDIIIKKHVESQGRSIGKNLLLHAIEYKGVYVYGIIYPLRMTRELRRKQQKNS